MPEIVTRLQKQIVDFWSELEKSQKNRIYITSAILAIAIAAGLFYITRTTYVTIISGAERSDIKEMLTVLEEGAIEAKVSEDGTSILVDSKDRNKAEFALAKEGYPKGGMTFEEAWSMIKISTTESDKKMLRNEYKKRSLVQQLKMFDNIKDASVEIAVPEPTLFEKEKKPTAYVRITPKGEITPEQIEGIVMVIAKSVENLDPKDVTIVDNYANNLNSQLNDSSFTKANSQEELRLKRAEELKKKVYNLYGGPSDYYDTIKVEASVFLDFNKEETKIKDIQPGTGLDGGALISMERSKENLENGQVGNIPGTDTNPGTENQVPSYQIGSDANSNYSKDNLKQNFEYKTVETNTEKALGTLDPAKSSIAATVWYGRKAADEAKLSTEFINELKSNISNATGIPVSNVSVIKCKLPPAEADTVPLNEQIQDIVDTYGFYALMFLLVIGLLIIASPRRKKEVQLVPEPAVALAATALQDEVEALQPISLDEKSEIKVQIEKFAKEKPEAVAQLLKNWLSDEWQ